MGWERKAITQVDPQVAAMIADTSRALQHVKRHQGELWSESYRTCTRNLNDEATTVEGMIDRGRQNWEFQNHQSAAEMNPGLTGK
jgi:hypothetical protein